MTRHAMILRTIAGLLVGGSFLAAPVTAAPSETVEVAGKEASLSIAPLRIEIDRGNAGGTVYLSNPSGRQLAVQARVFAWSQEGGEDAYAPSSDISVSPSISMIPPGETQIVRLIRKGAASPGEKRFRLVVDQLPDPTQTGASDAMARIRFTLPVFIDRDSAAPAALAWRVTDNRLELANTGGATSRIVGISVKTAGGAEVPVERNTLRYVHGNSTIAWPIGKGCSLGALKVTAQVDGQTVDAQPVSVCG